MATATRKRKRVRVPFDWPMEDRPVKRKRVRVEVAETGIKIPPGWFPTRSHVNAPVDCKCGLCEQKRLARCRKKFVYVASARQAGKSMSAKRRLVAELPAKKPWPDPRYFYAAPTYQQAKNICWDDFKRLIPKQWIAPGGVSESVLSITTIFGSTLYLFGLDKPARIEGFAGGFDGGIIDESADVKAGVARMNVLPQLSWRDGWLWRIGVPKRFGVGVKEFKDDFLKAAKGEDKDSAAFSWSAEDVIPDRAIKIAREMMASQDYAEQVGGLWQDAGGGVFYAFNEDYNCRPCGYRPELPIIVGSDFNVDPMAWVLCHIIEGTRLEVFDEIYMHNTNTPKTLEALWGRYGSHTNGFEFYGDATGRARKTAASMSDYLLIANDPRFKAAGRTLHYLQGNPPIHDRFASTNAMLCNAANIRRLHIDPRCKHLIEDFQSRMFVPGTNQLPPNEGMVGHCCLVAGTMVETDQGPVPIEQVEIGNRVLTRLGYKKVTWSGLTNNSANIATLECDGGSRLRGTFFHPIHSGTCFIPMGMLQCGNPISQLRDKEGLCASKRLRIEELSTLDSREHCISNAGLIATILDTCIDKCGLMLMEQFQKSIISIIKTGIGLTTLLKTWSAYLAGITVDCTTRIQRHLRYEERLWIESECLRRLGTSLRKVGLGTESMLRSWLPEFANAVCGQSVLYAESGFDIGTTICRQNVAQKRAICDEGAKRAATQRIVSAVTVDQFSQFLTNTINDGVIVPRTVQQVTYGKSGNEEEPVYDLTVDEAHEFFANGILVSNSDACSYVCHRRFPIVMSMGGNLPNITTTTGAARDVA